MSKLLLQLGNVKMEVEGSEYLVGQVRQAFFECLDAMGNRPEEQEEAPAADWWNFVLRCLKEDRHE